MLGGKFPKPGCDLPVTSFPFLGANPGQLFWCRAFEIPVLNCPGQGEQDFERPFRVAEFPRELEGIFEVGSTFFRPALKNLSEPDAVESREFAVIMFRRDRGV